MRQFRHAIAAAVAVALAMGAAAAEVSSEMAMAAAEAWVAANPGFGAAGGAVSAEARSENGALAWWTVRLSGGGAVFVSPETSIEPVLAAVPQYGGELPSGHPLVALLMRDVAARRAVIAAATASTASASSMRLYASAPAITNEAVAAAVEAAETKWGKLAAAQQQSGTMPRLKAPVLPPDFTVKALVPGFGEASDNNAYLRFWDQSNYAGGVYGRSACNIDTCFNAKTPKGYVCGCSATAGAALLQYFNVTQLLHNVERVCTVDGVETPLRTAGAVSPYDWSVLPAEIGGTDASTMAELDDDGKQAVVDILARAASDMGICIKMQYAASGSGAYTEDIAKAFVSDYGFYRAKYVRFNPKSAEYTNDLSRIYEDLCATNPVVLGIIGYDDNTGDPYGHQILGVGYGEDGTGTPYARLFMGWSGIGDAWYNLPEIDPDGSSLAFSLVDDAIVSIAYDSPIGHKTAQEALAAALVSHKPILLISGSSSGAAADVISYVNSNYGNNFEIYFADSSSDPLGDKNPSYGVFNPLVFDPSADGNRWAFYNGRLSYGTDKDETVIKDVLDSGIADWEVLYEQYLFYQEAALNGITVVENGVCTPVDGVPAGSYMGVDYLVHENAFTNGQQVVITAGYGDVEYSDVIWRVGSWAVYSNGVDIVAYGAGTNAQFQVCSNTVYTLYWGWDPEYVKLTTSTDGSGSVSPAGETWYKYGDTATVTASVPPMNGNWRWQFYGWVKDTDGCDIAGSAIIAPMTRPRNIVAQFLRGAVVTGGSADYYTLNVASDPADIAAPVAYGATSLSYGDNTLMAGNIAVQVPEKWTDATGGVWRCAGWTGTGSVPASGTGAVAGLMLTNDSSIVWNWIVEPVIEPAPAPIGPVTAGFTNSALVIYSTNDTQVAVETRVSNAVAGHWYSIWSSNEPGGPYAFVSMPYTGTAKMFTTAPVPGILKLVIVLDPADAARKFFRVAVTDEEPGI